MALSHVVGYPRIGTRRELKRATEAYWDGKVSREELLETARTLRLEAWTRMRDAGIALIPSNTFSLYDQVLDTTAMVGAVPARYRQPLEADVDLDTYFAMGRGAQTDGLDVTAMEMTKWFDTNYHYIVPELGPESTFRLASRKPLDEYLEARAAGIETVPVLVGPLTYLLQGKSPDAEGFDRLSLLPSLLPVYVEMLGLLRDAGAAWVQFDEPVLVEDRTPAELEALTRAYTTLAGAAGSTKLLVETYFGDVDESFFALANLPVAGIGLDLHRGQRNLEQLRKHGLPGGKFLAAGVVDGRNVWINNLEASLKLLGELGELVGPDRVIVSTSCSTMHAPIELERENRLDAEVRSWLAFANQKVDEVGTLAQALEDRNAVADALAANAAALESRRTSPRTNNAEVRARVAATTEADYRRHGNVIERRSAQRARLGLPAFPTTTIGSFPQTSELREARAALADKELTEEQYERVIEEEIERVVRLQEQLDIDVLVHGEPERNDMVEYFGERLAGFTFTRFGWVQSYGSRYVKPPIVFGDVARPEAMTVRWSTYAQSLTARPMKGMLTGPVTILNWSFVRDDQPRAETCRQIALAIRDEVVDLEAAGIKVIQIDEPALREGLPLRQSDWTGYLAWAVPCFRLSASGVRDDTQIHTHMCYADFNDIIEAISDLDADVISIENSRSDAELLEAFRDFKYDKEIGPGVYDIHSPRVPPSEEMGGRLREAMKVLDPDLVWVNPDCGLKTRRYEETVPALEHMVAAARELRAAL
ncbi:MAG: 5-methyltetrahydropteroyltriglutamate--homocysteine S-methyltransferase [Dehalococcoidia bacterium]|nr:5-methyltetrahydropteroyltriglutamate--homocysteine S-methyltransferase [Dehalococcoidia bacterium]